jgi:2-keto-4-pentenoate hydratase
MLNDNQIHGASDLLFHHWQDGRCLTALPQRMRPSTRTEGYAIQALLDHRTNEPLFG